MNTFNELRTLCEATGSRAPILTLNCTGVVAVRAAAGSGHSANTASVAGWGLLSWRRFLGMARAVVCSGSELMMHRSAKLTEEEMTEIRMILENRERR